MADAKDVEGAVDRAGLRVIDKLTAEVRAAGPAPFLGYRDDETGAMFLVEPVTRRIIWLGSMEEVAVCQDYRLCPGGFQGLNPRAYDVVIGLLFRDLTTPIGPATQAFLDRTSTEKLAKRGQSK